MDEEITTINLKDLPVQDENRELTREEREARVYNLSVELAETQAKRKSLMKAYTEEARRLKLEIKDLIKEDVNTEEVV